VSLTLISAPAVQPVTLADLKLQLGLSPMEDTDPVKSEQLSRQLRRLIAVATRECESITNTAFITQTWKWEFDGWPRVDSRYERPGYHAIRLPLPPYQSMVSFTCIGMDGISQAVTEYQVDAGGGTKPARIIRPYLQPWPILRAVPNNVALEFICGYGDSPDNVPETIKQAIVFLAQFYYENGAVTDLPIPRVINSLLAKETNWIS